MDGLNPIDPQLAAGQALDEGPPEESTEPGAAPEGEAQPEPEVSEATIRLQVFALVDTGDVLLRLLFGPAMAATREQKLELADAWTPYLLSIGGINLPLWIPGVLATAGLYGPKFRARKAVATPPEPRDAEAARTS